MTGDFSCRWPVRDLTRSVQSLIPEALTDLDAWLAQRGHMRTSYPTFRRKGLTLHADMTIKEKP